MVVIFQGETGGFITYEIPSTITAISGYVDAIGKHRRVYRKDGIIISGLLYIAKSGLSNLDPGDYTLLPQFVDSNTLIYFVDSDELQIIEVPDFFSNAVLVQGDSILVRLQNLENNQGILHYTAGPEGIQTSKLVALEGSVVNHADCSNPNHSGTIIGISKESASPGDQVAVQTIGTYTSDLLSFVFNGAALVGHNGNIVTIIPNDAVFIQFVGVITGAHTINLYIDADTIIV